MDYTYQVWFGDEDDPVMLTRSDGDTYEARSDEDKWVPVEVDEMGPYSKVAVQKSAVSFWDQVVPVEFVSRDDFDKFAITE